MCFTDYFVCATIAKVTKRLIHRKLCVPETRANSLFTIKVSGKRALSNES